VLCCAVLCCVSACLESDSRPSK
jgi:hypothetical protein